MFPFVYSEFHIWDSTQGDNDFWIPLLSTFYFITLFPIPFSNRGEDSSLLIIFYILGLFWHWYRQGQLQFVLLTQVSNNYHTYFDCAADWQPLYQFKLPLHHNWLRNHSPKIQSNLPKLPVSCPSSISCKSAGYAVWQYAIPTLRSSERGGADKLLNALLTSMKNPHHQSQKNHLGKPHCGCWLFRLR